MSHPALTGRRRWRPSRPAAAARSVVSGSAAGGTAAAHAGVAALDARRRLQLLLAGLWLLDGVLQLQSAMFTRQFPAMLAESAPGQTGVHGSNNGGGSTHSQSPNVHPTHPSTGVGNGGTAPRGMTPPGGVGPKPDWCA